MSRINVYWNSLKADYKRCQALAADFQTSAIRLLAGRIVAGMRYGIGNEEYFDDGYFLMNGIACKCKLTLGKSDAFVAKMNQREDQKYFNEKTLFMKRFAHLIRRKFLICADASFDDFVEFLRTTPVIIAKANIGQQGSTVRRLVVPQGQERETFELLRAGNQLLEEGITNHPDLDFGTSSLNSLRVYTLIDHDGNTQFIKASLKVGLGDNIQDNFSMGGVVYPVDIETGVIHTRGYDHHGNRYLMHPGTQIIMPGRKIPMFGQVKQVVLEASRVFPHIRYCGWDMAVTPSGVEIVEGNHDAGINILDLGDYKLESSVKIRKYM